MVQYTKTTRLQFFFLGNVSFRHRRFQRPDVRICVRTPASYAVDNRHLETEAQIANHKLFRRLTYFTLKDYEEERNNMLRDSIRK